MKKTTLSILLCLTFCFVSNAQSPCDYTLRMLDSGGDGWNGNSLDLIVGGTLSINDATFSSGSQFDITFSVSDGNSIMTVWNGGGSSGSETSYQILDSQDNVVASGFESSIPPTTATCPALVLPPNMTCATAAVISCGQTINSDSTNATGTDEGAGNCNSASSGLWYTIAGTGSPITISATTSFNATITVVSGSCGTFTTIGCADFVNSGQTENYTFNTIVSESYFIYVANWISTAPTTGTIDISATLGNETCSDAVPYTNFYTLFGAGNCTSNNSLDVSCATNGPAVNDPSCSGSFDYGAWFTWTATSEELSFTSGLGAPGIAFYEAGSCSSLTEVACLNNISGVVSGLTIGDNYLIHIWDDTSGNTVEFCLEERNIPDNDSCTDATMVMSLPYNISVDADQATNNAGSITAGSCGTMNDGVWYTFTPSNDGAVTIAISGVSGSDLEIGVYTGNCSTFNCVDSVNDSGFNGGETLTNLQVVSGTQYWINIGAFTSVDNPEGTFTLNISDITLGLDEFNKGFAINYYPNPVKDKLTLNAQKPIETVAIYNMLGQKVVILSPNAAATEVDISTFKSGIYFVNVSIGEAQKTVRIIKQ